MVDEVWKEMLSDIRQAGEELRERYQNIDLKLLELKEDLLLEAMKGNYASRMSFEQGRALMNDTGLGDISDSELRQAYDMVFGDTKKVRTRDYMKEVREAFEDSCGADMTDEELGKLCDQVDEVF